MTNNIKKFISILLTFSLLTFPPNYSTYAMSEEAHPLTQPASEEKAPYSAAILIGVGVVGLFCAIVGFLAGYITGNNLPSSDGYDKEITFEGTVLMPKGTIPDGTFYSIPHARNYINRLFKEEVPKLNKKDSFPATYIAGLEALLRVVSHHFEGSTLEQELLTVSHLLNQLILYEDKPVTVGYLVDLLKQSQNLISQAEAQSSKKSDL